MGAELACCFRRRRPSGHPPSHGSNGHQSPKKEGRSVSTQTDADDSPQFHYYTSSHEDWLLGNREGGWRCNLLRQDLDASVYAFKTDHEKLVEAKNQILGVLEDLKCIRSEGIRRLKVLGRRAFARRKFPRKKGRECTLTLRIKESVLRQVLKDFEGSQVTGPEGLA